METIKNAGAKLANIAFNLAQRKDLPADILASLDATRKEWDAAVRLASQAQAVTACACDERTSFEKVACELHLFRTSLDREIIQGVDSYKHAGLNAWWLFWQKQAAIAPPADAKVAPPEFSRDPDGDLALDWVVGDASLSVSFSKAGVVSWATGIEGASACGSQQVAQDSGRDAALTDAAILSATGHIMPETFDCTADYDLAIVRAAMAAQQGEKGDA